MIHKKTKINQCEEPQEGIHEEMITENTILVQKFRGKNYKRQVFMKRKEQTELNCWKKERKYALKEQKPIDKR